MDGLKFYKLGAVPHFQIQHIAYTHKIMYVQYIAHMKVSQIGAPRPIVLPFKRLVFCDFGSSIFRTSLLNYIW